MKDPVKIAEAVIRQMRIRNFASSEEIKGMRRLARILKREMKG